MVLKDQFTNIFNIWFRDINVFKNILQINTLLTIPEIIMYFDIYYNKFINNSNTIMYNTYKLSKELITNISYGATYNYLLSYINKNIMLCIEYSMLYNLPISDLFIIEPIIGSFIIFRSNYYFDS